MENSIILILSAFVISTACGFIIIPHIVNFCIKKNLYDIPNARKVHKNAIPRLGGICFLPCTLIAFIFGIAILNQLTGQRQITIGTWSVMFLISLSLIYIIGIVDDIVGVRPRTKFAVQIIAASLLPLSGLYMGVLTAYLFFNIWGKPEKGHKIFMGDSGSLTLGFILGFLLIKFAMHNPNVMPYRNNSLLITYTLLIVPCFDVVRVIITRLKNRHPIFKADKNHIHHKLMRAGMSQHQALVTILLLAATFIVLNKALRPVMKSDLIVLTDILVYTGFQLVTDIFIRKNERRLTADNGTTAA